ncbi:putative lipid kinase YegS-like protein [Chitiniphilus shinanonensis]|uniref:Lipid kinase YegS-like protein n=1 Tax=Chitiniphilus shinanonensis TaxID=553088 RepID=A0ABQ6BQY5_9NEIS|nr:lipid kinase YegS [Chitiniphilus shinanonensis]GLS04236.1 putative lipid kinase YegS-like protein [Chitiniphilus shinanonensis]
MTAPLHRLIVNGKAALAPELRDAVALARQAGHALEVRVTWEGGDAARYVAEALADGAANLIAGGGDGTLNEVATALLAHEAAARPPLGLLPLGTANDFARGAALPLALPEALRLALLGEPRAIDAARVGDRAFVNMATGGFGTQVTLDTPEQQKSALGPFAYLLTGLKRLNAIEAEQVRIEGPDFQWEGDFLALAIGNGVQAGGGHRLCPQARLDDGLLDLRILAGGELLPALLEGLLVGDEAERVVGAQLPWLTLEAPREIRLNLDGEPLAGTRFRIEVVPGALRLRLPPDSPLLGQP